MNPRLDILQPYPFERLREQLKNVTPPDDLPHISMGMGEPRLPAPKIFLDTLTATADGFSRYPLTAGTPELRMASASWLCKRFDLPQLATDVPGTGLIPCSGTREALFGIAQAVVGQNGKSRVLMPNPFYQIYEGAALWAGGTLHLVPATQQNGFLPDYAGLPKKVLDDTCLLYLCTPSNPTGAVASMDYLTELIELADRHDFVIASDECYSEIYPDEAAPPAGLLQAAHRAGNSDYKNCVVFHSLSKRSNLPGARVGFVAGDADVLADFLKLRIYTGCTISPPIQAAAAATWGDETHVVKNRAAYRENFAAVKEILGDVLPVQTPDAGFYLWLRAPGGGEAFSRKLYGGCNITVLPGAYLSRPDTGTSGKTPGDEYVRMALVDGESQVREAARRIRKVL